MIHYRWARGDYGRLPAFAAEFVVMASISDNF